ncbi:MAG: hypothetical protein IFNCLDLE_02686 [Ignavibacteriaceae bacterium]|nr:hypothetical protein [Ignavibacteriaceae bacterium]
MLPATREKISLAKTKIDLQTLREAADNYHQLLLTNSKLLPTIQGYCLAAGISPSYLYSLAQEMPEVEEIIEMIQVKQEEYLLTRPFTEKANVLMSMFLLKAKHHYQDEPKQLTQNNNFNISPDILADAIKLMRANSDKSAGK